MVNLFNKGISGDVEIKLRGITDFLAKHYYFMNSQRESRKPIDDWVDAENTITDYVSKYYSGEKSPGNDITGNHLDTMVRFEFDYYKKLLLNADDVVLTGPITGNILLSKIYNKHARNTTKEQLENPKNILEVKKNGKIAYYLNGKTSHLIFFLNIIESFVDEGKFSSSIEMLDGRQMYSFKTPSATSGKEKIIGLSINLTKETELYDADLFIFDYGDKVDKKAIKYLTDIFSITDLAKVDVSSDKDKYNHIKEYLSTQLKNKLF